jgi:DNA-binding HxlR family transcriptional regulator
MNYSKLSVGSLEQVHALKILVILEQAGPMSRSELYGLVISSNRTMMDRVNELMALGLLEDVLIDERPYRALQLTERGRAVAEHVAAIEELMSRK